MLRMQLLCGALFLPVAGAAGSLYAQTEVVSQVNPDREAGHSAVRRLEGNAAEANGDFPLADAESQGVHPDALTRLSNLIRGFLDADEIVGAELLIIKNRYTILHEAFGVDGRLRNEPMKKNTIFSIRSMTKPLVGVLTQMMIDEGVLQLSAPVAKYIPAFDNTVSRKITVQQLLTHRSGLPMRSPGRLWSDYGSYKSVQELAAYWGNYGPLLFEPGTDYHYADANVDTLAAVIETVTGNAAEELIQRRLLNPLGMEDTIPLLREGDVRVNRVATKYAGGRGGWRPFWSWNGKPYFAFPMFAQGFYSTTSDYACFLAMLLDGGEFAEQRLLSQEAVRRVLTPVSETTMPTGVARVSSSYGQLMHLYNDRDELIVFGHSGSDGTYAWVWPGEDLIVLYFTQSRGSNTMARMEAVLDTLLGRPVGHRSGP